MWTIWPPGFGLGEKEQGDGSGAVKSDEMEGGALEGRSGERRRDRERREEQPVEQADLEA